MRPGARFNFKVCKFISTCLLHQVPRSEHVLLLGAVSGPLLHLPRFFVCNGHVHVLTLAISGNPHTSSLSIDTCSNQSAGLRSEYTRSVEQQRRPFSLSCSVVDMTYKSSDVVEMILVPGIFSHASTPRRSSHRIEIWSYRRYDDL